MWRHLCSKPCVQGVEGVKKSRNSATYYEHGHHVLCSEHKTAYLTLYSNFNCLSNVLFLGHNRALHCKQLAASTLYFSTISLVSWSFLYIPKFWAFFVSLFLASPRVCVKDVASRFLNRWRGPATLQWPGEQSLSFFCDERIDSRRAGAHGSGWRGPCRHGRSQRGGVCKA